jgi:hypothetical protein
MLEITAGSVHGLALGWSAARPLLAVLLSRLPDFLSLLLLDASAKLHAAAAAMWLSSG